MIFPSRIDENHCLINRRYAVYTPPMHKMINKIGDWIDDSVPGAYIYGASRLGKSRCIQWHLKDVLEARFKKTMPLVVWNRAPESGKSERVFWSNLLSSTKFNFLGEKKFRNKSDIQASTVDRLISISENSKCNQIFLLIDEAQDITFNEWKWLLGLQNTLDYEGYQLSVFSIGTHQLSYRHDFMALTGNAHIAARFLVHHARFSGLNSIDEIRYVLRGYDEDSEWPEKSGISFLNYFSPHSYSDGLRLSDHSENLWNALIELTPEVKSKIKHEFPMQHVARATENILFQLCKDEDWGKVTSYDNWIKELTRSNFPGHMRLILSGG